MEYSDSGGESDLDKDLDEDLLGPDDLFEDEAEEGGDNDHASTKEESKKDDEAIEVVKKVKPKRIVKNPRVVLNESTLRGPNGLSELKKMFSDFKFKGNGHEKEDLTKIMGVLQQWMCYKLCPNYDFESCMFQLENLGKKRTVQTLIKKYRLGIDDWGEKKSDVEDNAENNMEVTEDVGKNDFDSWLAKEMEKIDSDDELNENDCAGNQMDVPGNAQKEAEFTLTQEQLDRIARNRKLAEERRLQRMKSQQEDMEISSEKNGDENHIPLENITLTGQ